MDKGKESGHETAISYRMLTNSSWRNKLVNIRLAEAAEEICCAFGAPLLTTMSAMRVARFAKKMTVKILWYAEKKLSRNHYQLCVCKDDPKVLTLQVPRGGGASFGR